MQQAEYECRKCGRIYPSKEKMFCSNCGGFLSAKLPTRPPPKPPGGKKNPTFSIPPLPPTETVNIYTLFAEFNTLPPISYGGGLVRQCSALWITDRRRAYKEFREKFSVDNLINAEKLSRDYEHFLYFRNNLSWTNLHRTGLKALKQPEKLWDLITFVQDESVDIKLRINKCLQGELHINGIGKNILTALLHVMNPDVYGVWNSRTQETLEIIRRNPPLRTDLGLTYAEINKKLIELSRELDTDLTTIDGLMWYVSKRIGPKLDSIIDM
jgi:hypothetical protein